MKWKRRPATLLSLAQPPFFLFPGRNPRPLLWYLFPDGPFRSQAKPFSLFGRGEDTLFREERERQGDWDSKGEVTE